MDAGICQVERCKHTSPNLLSLCDYFPCEIIFHIPQQQETQILCENPAHVNNDTSSCRHDSDIHDDSMHFEINEDDDGNDVEDT